MPSVIGKKPLSSDRKPTGKARRGKDLAPTYPPVDLASLIRGLYQRVARELDVDPSYVSRVARRERRSKIIEDALRRELSKIVENVKNRRDAKSRAPRPL
jgi:hypothetical protein